MEQKNIPKEIKDEYVGLLKTNAFGDHEEKMFNSMIKMSEAYVNNDLRTRQYGYSDSTNLLNDETFENPYKDIIEKNKSVVNARKK
jgi:hypothetical protein